MADRLRIKRIYAPPSEADGQRVLVDRIWPRGVRRDEAALTLWLKEIAPPRLLGNGSGTIRSAGRNSASATGRSSTPIPRSANSAR